MYKLLQLLTGITVSLFVSLGIAKPVNKNPNINKIIEKLEDSKLNVTCGRGTHG